jgi:hypothetical protein
MEFNETARTSIAIFGETQLFERARMCQDRYSRRQLDSENRHGGSAVTDMPKQHMRSRYD